MHFSMCVRCVCSRWIHSQPKRTKIQRENGRKKIKWKKQYAYILYEQICEIDVWKKWESKNKILVARFE